MKTLATLLTAAFLIFPSSGDEEDKSITLTPTYPDGFGVVFKREIVIRKSVPTPRAKFKGGNEIYLAVPEVAENSRVLVSGDTSEIHDKLVKALGDRPERRLKIIGYESIRVSGMPGLGKSVEHDEVLLPAGFGWGVRNVLHVMSIIDE